MCSKCFANTDTLLTNRTVGHTDKAGAQLPGRIGKAEVPILSGVFSSSLYLVTGPLVIEANAAPGDAFSNAGLFIAITFKGVIGLLSKALSDSCAEKGEPGRFVLHALFP